MEKNYKSFIGPEKLYDQIGQIVFDLLQKHGLKKTNTVLDIGCGSLRVGKHLIPWLNKGKYYGIEPNKWLVSDGIDNELDKDIEKNPSFDHNGDFDLKCFDKKYNFIFANSIFIHASLNQIEKCLSQIDDILKDGGSFIFNFFVGPDSKSKDWTYPGAVTYTKATIEGLLKKYNLNYEYIDCKYPGKQIWIKVTK